MSTEPLTLTAIYDSALSDRHWSRALDYCKDAVGADASMLYQFSATEVVSFSLDETSSNFVSASSHLTEYNRLVAEGRGTNYDQEGLGYVHTTPPFRVVLDEDIWALEASYFARPEVQIGMRAGWLRRSFLNLSTDPSTMSGLIFLYGRDKDAEIPKKIFEAGPFVAPHVSKAAEVHRFTSEVRKKYNAVLAVLDRIPTGVLMVSHSREIILQNRRAQQLLEERSGLIADNSKRLIAQDEDTTAALNAAIASASATANGEGVQAGVNVRLPRRDRRTPLVAVISPVRDADIEIEKGLTGALITLIDPLSPLAIDPDIVALVYGLTKAEARVAKQILKGHSNTEISERLHVSSETIKSHIGAIFRKSGCQSRVAFVWRMFQLAPPIM